MKTLLRAKQCAEFFGVSRSAWERWCREDANAPKPCIRRERYVAWDADDVERYHKLVMAQSSSAGDVA